MFVDLVVWIANRFSRFGGLFAAVAVGLLKAMGAPTYVILLVFVAAWAWWTLYQEVVRSREEALKSREVLSEAVVRATYSVHRLILMSPKERELHEADDEITPDPYQTVRVLERFVELADEKGVDEARRFLGRMDLVQLEAREGGPRKMNLQLARAFTAELKQDHDARWGSDSETGHSARQSTDAAAPSSADGQPAT